MVWDLGKAMQKKEEFESARLMDFEFRLRVRATRLFAQKLGLDEKVLVGETALRSERDLLDLIAKLLARSKNDVARIYGQCVGEARQTLIAERGDPTPNRLG
jgi:hypothetical protein